MVGQTKETQMTAMKKMALVIGIAAMAYFALPQKSQAVSCIYSPCVDHVYGICCGEYCKYFSC
jgi:hypothetical protein